MRFPVELREIHKLYKIMCLEDIFFATNQPKQAHARPLIPKGPTARRRLDLRVGPFIKGREGMDTLKLF